MEPRSFNDEDFFAEQGDESISVSRASFGDTMQESAAEREANLQDWLRRSPGQYPSRAFRWAWCYMPRVFGESYGEQDVFQYLKAHKKDYFLWVIDGNHPIVGCDRWQGMGRWLDGLTKDEKNRLKINSTLEAKLHYDLLNAW